MPPPSSDMLSPSIFGAVSRFRRLVMIVVAFSAAIALIYTAIAGVTYAGKAAIVIAQPPTYLPPFPVSGSHSTLAAYVNQQVALMQSQRVSDGAADIVNQKIAGANVSGSEIHSALVIKPQTGAAAGTNTTTQVIVSMSTPEIAAASANAVLASYIANLHAQIRLQADQSLAALDKSIADTKAALNNLPAPSTTPGGSGSKNTPTIVVHPPATTTTRVPRTTTTHVHTTTTTHPQTTTTHPQTTTTHPQTTSSTTAAALGNSPINVQLTGFDAVVTTTTGLQTTATTSTTAPSTTSTTAASSSTNSTTAADRAVLLSTLINLTRARTQVHVDEQADLTYQPTLFPATVPTTTSNGNYFRNFVIGVLVGFLIGAIAAYLLASRRRQFKRADEPELVYGVPLITPVPVFISYPWLPTGLPILTEPMEESAESIRVIATALRSLRGTEQPIIVAFSAAIPRSGTTTMVANTGLALAEMDEQVLVIDGDPIGRGLTRTLTDTERDEPLPTPRNGFSEVVGGCPLVDTVVPADANPRLRVLTSGKDPDLALRRWSAQSIRLALNDATSHFDIVLIDVPPVGSSSYGIDLAGAASNLIMVVPYLDLIDHHVPLNDKLRFASVNLLGYVFNGAPTTNDFSAYYPVLHRAGSETTLAPSSPAQRGALVHAGSASFSPPGAATTPPPDRGADTTGITPVVQSDLGPITEAIGGIDTSSENPTQEVPELKPE